MLKVDDVQAMLKRCEAFHGHLCLGQVVGVRMAQKGLELVAAEDIKDLIVMVENDRCITDAIIMATGVRLGRRSLKFYDYGKMAATFVNLKTDVAWRLHSRGEGDQLPKDESMAWALAASDEELLSWRSVTVDFNPGDLPGPPVRIAQCNRCGETVLDYRDVPQGQGEDLVLCRACAFGTYYQPMT
ncbi:thioredoxin-like domain and zinc finger protein [Syntrophotalea carbinolica DSM 2380]|uniref:Thioredoxin-like domain and zinc finger protein n=1 Tax=Syntrophotalea carbinolica (strain DSM 2380 / NBRC 103641 / GraBd1) TaxID=338963 RepID=Q3A875_SYNC1|nr:FmdE family protein [Syntrophotalea carbinolica]ABA87417.1 thioredoxin-like domain and zinc finger protein [Syntrophotalea carbinolica DSM 2380]